MERKIVLGIGGSSGAIYAARFLEKTRNLPQLQLGVVMSENAKINWELEIGPFDANLFSHVRFYDAHDFFAPFASGSAMYDSMVVMPSSMGLLARIASGFSSDLVTRAADVMLKEKRKLIIVPRETPLNLIHIKNMEQLVLAGAIICPATPSFYSQPKTITELVDTVVDRVLDLLDLNIENIPRWGSNTDQ